MSEDQVKEIKHKERNLQQAISCLKDRRKFASLQCIDSAIDFVADLYDLSIDEVKRAMDQKGIRKNQREERKMKYKRQLRCIKDYDEDLTGNDDFATVWTAGKVYGAVKHHNGTYTVETNMGTKGIIGAEYSCTPDYFEEVNTN